MGHIRVAREGIASVPLAFRCLFLGLLLFGHTDLHLEIKKAIVVPTVRAHHIRATMPSPPRNHLDWIIRSGGIDVVLAGL